MTGSRGEAGGPETRSIRVVETLRAHSSSARERTDASTPRICTSSTAVEPHQHVIRKREGPSHRSLARNLIKHGHAWHSVRTTSDGKIFWHTDRSHEHTSLATPRSPGCKSRIERVASRQSCTHMAMCILVTALLPSNYLGGTGERDSSCLPHASDW